MLMTIFGAGASYDSALFRVQDDELIPRYRVRPPLASSLFEHREYFDQTINRFTVIRALVQRMRALPEGASVEQALDQVQAESERHAFYASQLVGLRFYLQKIIWHCGSSWHQALSGVTNYAGLLDRLDYWREINEERLSFVTFNYDTLLEEAAGDSFGFVGHDLADYVAFDQYAILKCHGSVNWVRDVDDLHLGTSSEDADWSSRRVIAKGPNLILSENYRLITEVDEMRSGDTAFVPAIAVPLERKTTFEMPATHKARLVESIEAADKLLIVGWRATETHFLDLWKETRRGQPVDDCLIITRSPIGAQDVGGRLKKAGVVSTFTTSEQGFSNATKVGDVERFLGLNKDIRVKRDRLK